MQVLWVQLQGPLGVGHCVAQLPYFSIVQGQVELRKVIEGICTLSPEEALEGEGLVFGFLALGPPLLSHESVAHTKHQVALREEALRMLLLPSECLLRKLHPFLNVAQVLQAHLCSMGRV